MFDANSGWAWAGVNDGSRDHLLRTTDGGQTWSDLSPRAFPYSRGRSFFLDAQTAWLSTFDANTNSAGLIHTTDGGKSWTVFDQIVGPDANYHFLNQTYGWAETADIGAGNALLRVFETMDGGKSWKPLVINPEHPEANLPAGTIHLCNICGDALNFYPPSRVVTTFGDLATAPGGALRFSITMNLGRTWQDLNLPLPSNKLSTGLVEPGSPIFFDRMNGLLPAVTMKQNADGSTFDFSVLFVYATSDGGLTWFMRPALVRDVDAYHPQLDIVSVKDWFVPCGSNLCVTHDGALGWLTITPGIDFGREGTDRYLTQLAFVDVSHGWAIISDKDTSHLYRTMDGGSTWDELPVNVLP